MKKIGYLQSNPVFGEKEQNLERISELLAGGVEADLIVLTELSTTGYSFKSMEELSESAESIPEGESTSRLIELAKHRHAKLTS